MSQTPDELESLDFSQPIPYFVHQYMGARDADVPMCRYFSQTLTSFRVRKHQVQIWEMLEPSFSPFWTASTDLFLS